MSGGTGRGRRAAWLPPLFLLGAAAMAATPPPEGLSLAGHRTLWVAAGAVVIWTSELLPPGLTALLVVLMLAASGATASFSEALVGFASPVPYFLIGVLTLAMAVQKVGLAERLARFFLRRARGATRPLFWQMVLSFPLLAFLLPSATTRSAILAHVYDRALALGGVGRGAPFARAVMMGLNSINRLASTTILTGGMTPIVAAALIGGMGWGRWFAMLAVPYYLTLTIGSLSIYAWYMRGGSAVRLAAPPASAPRPFSGAEVRTVAIVLSASAFWLTDALHGLHPAIPALAAWTLLLSPRVGVLDWKEFERNFAWSSFLILASSLSLGMTLSATGAARWLAEALLGLAPVLAGRPYLLFAALLLASIPVRLLVPNIIGFLAITIPIATEFGAAAGLSPVVCGLAVMIIGDTALFYPAQSASSLVVYERGHLEAGEIFRFGLYMTAVAFVVTMTFNLMWWNWIGTPWRGG